MSKLLIELIDVNKYYKLKKQQISILKNINLKVYEGDFLIITGKSGSGKTTLMNLLGFLDDFQSGQYIFNGTDVSNFSENKKCILRNEEIGFVFQQFYLVDSLNVYKNVELPLLYSRGKKVKDNKESINYCLELVELEDKMYNMPNELSGGQQQRVALGRALVNSPSIIFADEPTGSLDSENSRIIMEHFINLNKKGKTIVMVTHDLDLCKYGTRVISIVDGVVKEGAFCDNN